MNDEFERDPYNTAVAAILNERYIATGSELARLVKATGLGRNTVLRYLAGERDIRVAELRKFAKALGLNMAVIMREAERSIQ